jgi:hypothetical protein
MKTVRIVCLFLTAALTIVYPGAAFPADSAGKVVYLRGKARIERKKSNLPAKLRSVLLESDNIVTRRHARVKMLFRDDSVLTLGQNSRLIIKQYLYNPESKRAESIYELADGKLRAVVGNAGFRVTTPTAFAAARGTVYITWYDSTTNTTGVAVIEGSVSVGNTDPSVPGVRVLTAGQMTLVPPNQPPQPPAPYVPGTGAAGGTNLSDVGGTVPPDAALPGPPAGLIPQAAVNIIPTAPPLDQTPGGAVTPVSLHLNFQ